MTELFKKPFCSWFVSTNRRLHLEKSVLSTTANSNQKPYSILKTHEERGATAQWKLKNVKLLCVTLWAISLWTESHSHKPASWNDGNQCHESSTCFTTMSRNLSNKWKMACEDTIFRLNRSWSSLSTAARWPPGVMANRTCRMQFAMQSHIATHNRSVYRNNGQKMSLLISSALKIQLGNWYSCRTFWNHFKNWYSAEIFCMLPTMFMTL